MRRLTTHRGDWFGNIDATPPPGGSPGIIRCIGAAIYYVSNTAASRVRLRERAVRSRAETQRRTTVFPVRHQKVPRSSPPGEAGQKQTLPNERREASLVLLGLLHGLDHQYVDVRSTWLQLEAQLLLQCCEQGGFVAWVWRRPWPGARWRTARPASCKLVRERELEVVRAVEARLILDDAIERGHSRERAERRRQRIDRDTARRQSTG